MSKKNCERKQVSQKAGRTKSAIRKQRQGLASARTTTTSVRTRAQAKAVGAVKSLEAKLRKLQVS